jgi:hypothetical protein
MVLDCTTLTLDLDECDHDWQLDERPSNEAKPVKLKCAKCGAVKDYSEEPPKPHPVVELAKAIRAMPIIPGLCYP